MSSMRQEGDLHGTVSLDGFQGSGILHQIAKTLGVRGIPVAMRFGFFAPRKDQEASLDEPLRVLIYTISLGSEQQDGELPVVENVCRVTWRELLQPVRQGRVAAMDTYYAGMELRIVQAQGSPNSGT